MCSSLIVEPGQDTAHSSKARSRGEKFTAGPSEQSAVRLAILQRGRVDERSQARILSEPPRLVFRCHRARTERARGLTVSRLLSLRNHATTPCRYKPSPAKRLLIQAATIAKLCPSSARPPARKADLARSELLATSPRTRRACLDRNDRVRNNQDRAPSTHTPPRQPQTQTRDRAQQKDRAAFARCCLDLSG